ncbi:hypothetical protein SCLCIDRAFT_53909, partial [Scleroderma citrinum Foug A]
MVIPAMDYIDTTFTTGLLKKEQLDPTIRAAVGLAKWTLNRYYSLTDTSELYHIAMVLHPRYKLEYFKQAGWTLEWVATAQNLVRNTFKTSYVSCHLPGDASEDHSSDQEEDNVGTGNIFNTLPTLVKPTLSLSTNELNMYLSTGVENVSDVLTWWHERCTIYPRL